MSQDARSGEDIVQQWVAALEELFSKNGEVSLCSEARINCEGINCIRCPLSKPGFVLAKEKLLNVSGTRLTKDR